VIAKRCIFQQVALGEKFTHSEANIQNPYFIFPNPISGSVGLLAFRTRQSRTTLPHKGHDHDNPWLFDIPQA
jgi:hypothetical protein